MERLTDPAQGYCEMYCENYGVPGCWPETCARKNEVAMYEKLKEIEGIVPFDRLLELAFADRAGRCEVLPCGPGDTVWLIVRRGLYRVEQWTVHQVYKRDGGGWWFKLRNQMLSQLRPTHFEECTRAISSFGKTIFLTREAAEAALKQNNE